MGCAAVAALRLEGGQAQGAAGCSCPPRLDLASPRRRCLPASTPHTSPPHTTPHLPLHLCTSAPLQILDEQLVVFQHNIDIIQARSCVSAVCVFLGKTQVRSSEQQRWPTAPVRTQSPRPPCAAARRPTPCDGPTGWRHPSSWSPAATWPSPCWACWPALWPSWVSCWPTAQRAAAARHVAPGRQRDAPASCAEAPPACLQVWP